MRWSFYANIRGEEWRADVLLGEVGGTPILQVVVRCVGQRGSYERVSQPRYLRGVELARVRAGMRAENRMPSWALADVLQDLGISEEMCEVVRASELNHLGTAISGAQFWS